MKQPDTNGTFVLTGSQNLTVAHTHHSYDEAWGPFNWNLAINVAANNTPLVSGIWSSMPAVVGETISLFIFGDNFDTAPGGTQVFINGIQQFIVQVVTPEMLIVRVTVSPAMLGGAVTVTTAQGSADSASNFGDTLTGVNITGVWPGTAAAGDFVFVFGSGYVLPVSVNIGATPVPLVQVVTEDMFIMMVPPGASTGPVSVTAPGGSAISGQDLVVAP